MGAPNPIAKGIGLACFVSAVAIAVVFAGFAGYFHRAFQVDKANFALFAAFYGVTQGVERLLEIVSQFVPPWGDSDQDKSDRAIEMLGIATLAGVAASMVFGLYFLRAIGVNYGHSNNWETAADVIVTGLIISGGTKPLHDLIKLVEKARS
jgi:hypothetical protein